jgi:hypothetical protein
MSVPRKVEADAQAVLTSWGTVRPDARISDFSFAISAASRLKLYISELARADNVSPKTV